MKLLPILLTMLFVSLCASCSPDSEVVSPRPPVVNPGGDDDPEGPALTTRKMTLTIGSAVYAATLAENPAAEAFGAMLPMTMDMGEMNGNEKYYYLPENLPTSAYAPGEVRNGDIMLFGANCLVLFYKTFSTPYGYTRIGSVDDASGLEAALGRNDVTVKFETKNE